MEDAEEAARRVMEFDPSFPKYHQWGDADTDDARTVARAYLALLSSRPSIIEECAKVADGWLKQHGDLDVRFTSARKYASDAVKDIADAIRSLKEEKEPRDET